MKVKVKTKVSLNHKLIDEIENGAKYRALEKTAIWVLGEIVSSGKVPFDTGELERSGFVKTISDELVKIVFDTPYARRWYFNADGVSFRRDKNPNAQDHWMDDFIHGDRKQEVIDKFAEFYKEELGRVFS
jgi:hypothetical protein